MDKLLLLSLIVFGLIIGGAIACLPLYKWDIKKFLRTSLCIKILFWIPIYGVFLLTILGGVTAGIAVSLLVILIALYEYARRVKKPGAPIAVRLYLIFFILATYAMAVLYEQIAADHYVALLTVIYLGSVLSDVAAFFLGTYVKGHPLPTWINPGKNWQGVAGQLIGGVAGVLLASVVMGVTTVWWLGLLIGAASAIGDLFNSIAKRQLAIKDWGNTIPGHGGVLDRCSSLSTTFLAVLLAYNLTSLLL